MNDIYVEMFFEVYEYMVKKYQLSYPAIVGINASLSIFRSQDMVVEKIANLYDFWLSYSIISEISFEWRCSFVSRIIGESPRNLSVNEGYLVLSLVKKLVNYCNS
ncbi:hypothetical protein VF04_04300 [Nostoc linckia z7]|uniref:Uncharacterized protein n=2 Tax=Nostoc linckia TaxID=92942 RepID=A0A9Q6EN64_NOSLI|nr:hypothetical protein VF02_11785 [Nostoc linckia z1]PHJ70189.1 hypothetical protein VF05_11945 [Nostoc linckia z3]PHJ75090.1 hypothetical protein VF03_12105 [Nostoc linckia z2]PHJ82978.1 hypothetical protein VF06_14605 [Nostoc linckia z4]PHJ89075.1 hypothetical protein VF07_13800 [Nostoc linckia z6]PHK00134.1 hypothetical protein VF04_04300 [Nostoc linckia z7]PHK06797.1 hypothetical protein VF08_03430 [Nostoc linckia z8]PHK23200.1 hypothetical protein VF11_02495 [Nostoc linckia z14]PHK269